MARASVYKNPETLWQTSLDRDPACWLASENLGDLLLKNGRTDEAIAQFQKTLAIKPDDAVAYSNIGKALVQKGQVDEAIVQFQKAIAIQPDYAFAHYNLGDALLQKGQVDEAIAHPTGAENCRVLPKPTTIFAMFCSKRKTDEAITHFESARTSA